MRRAYDPLNEHQCKKLTNTFVHKVEFHKNSIEIYYNYNKNKDPHTEQSLDSSYKGICGGPSGIRTRDLPVMSRAL